MKKIEQDLEREGYRFNFFQALNLLEQSCADCPQIGYLGPVEREIVKILPSSELCFSPADVSRIERRELEEEKASWTVFENFLGLYGPNSATPIFIAEMIAQCPDENDPLRDFLDIFNHRVLSLYYRAWKKHNLLASLSTMEMSSTVIVLRTLLGADYEVAADNWLIPPERLLRYANYLSSSNRPASGLENIIADYFSLRNVRVIQFVSRKFKPPTSMQSEPEAAGTFGRLGESCVLGETIIDIAGQFKVQLGSLSMQQFQLFQPDSPAYDELVFLTHLYTKRQLDFCLELVLKPGQVRPVTISSNAPVGALGRSSWVGYPSGGESSVTLDVSGDYHVA